MAEMQASNYINKRKHGKNYKHRVIHFPAGENSDLGGVMAANDGVMSTTKPTLNLTTFDFLKETRDPYITGRNRANMQSFAIKASLDGPSKTEKRAYETLDLSDSYTNK